MSNYSERAYFPDASGRRDFCKHCAERDEHIRLSRKRILPVAYRDRRMNGRAFV